MYQKDNFNYSPPVPTSGYALFIHILSSHQKPYTEDKLIDTLNEAESRLKLCKD